MRFEITMITLGGLATVLLAAAGAQGYAAVGPDDLAPHLLLALPALMAIALPHVWVAVYLAGTRRALGREPGAAGDLPAARALGHRALVAAVAALATLVALVVSGALAFTGTGAPAVHGVLFWLLLLVQPAALALEWRMLAGNHRLLARHGG
jgi:hypothetical protein